MSCHEKVAVDQAQLIMGTPFNSPVEIDACLAPLILELNRRGIETTSSCCGHGKQVGFIVLADRTAITLWKCGNGRVR